MHRTIAARAESSTNTANRPASVDGALPGASSCRIAVSLTSRQHDTADGAASDDDGRFRGQLRDDAHAAGAECEPDGDLAAPLNRARELQIDDIRNRDEQHERCDALEPERDPSRVSQLAGLGPARGDWREHDPRGRIRVGGAGDDALIRGARFLRGRRVRDAVGQPQQHRQRAVDPAGRPDRWKRITAGMQRRPDVDRLQAVADETGRHHPDDGEGAGAETDPSRPNAVGSAPNAAPPERSRSTRTTSVPAGAGSSSGSSTRPCAAAAPSTLK